ncbi:MAG TPA: BON domain-containing protein, partial [Verrucomicrobiae bacterium]|nr:BON domain-containing protein [Verrucomicrobiae bacterium]
QSARAITVGLCFGAISLLTLTTGCAGDRYHESTGENIDDRGITGRVKSALGNDTEFKYDKVNVTTFKGTTQLSGFVDTSAQKSRAETLAKGVEGVKEVKNGITVKE